MAIGQSQFPRTLPKITSAKTVGLISDTHIPSRAKAIPEYVFRVFENVDYIIHAGDLVDLSVIEELERCAPVLAVHGNMDSANLCSVLPEVDSMKLMDYKIGVIHDPGSLYGMEKLREVAKQNLFDVLVFGHTHSSSVKWEGKTLFVNPGSPTCPEPPFLCKPTVGLLKITKQAVTPEIIHI
ncbi:MAG: metallophosphoesterase [Candidatus Bathyarchaeota archaeon]|nr:metallophosphoesterase [Candidatus Bathyarchaeota archaeon]